MANSHEIISQPPTGSGLMDANMVASLHAVIEQAKGSASRDRVFADAGIEDLPVDDGTLSEARVARQHSLVRENWPGEASEILDMAGRVAAEVFVSQNITPKAILLLQNMPWSVSAWLVGKAARLNSAGFRGSGTFAIQTTSRLAIYHNPLAIGVTADQPICHFHAAMFEHMFQRMSHRDFVCRETACMAAGHDHCSFELTL